MGYFEPDVYNQPEAFGLQPVAELDYSSGFYEFDLRVVWQHDDGTLYTARDAGCSCPSPFEDYTSLDKLDAVDLGLLQEELEHELAKGYNGLSSDSTVAFLAKVREAMPRQCVSCNRLRSHRKDDYVCRACRAAMDSES